MTASYTSIDQRIEYYKEMVDQMVDENYSVLFAPSEQDGLGRLGESLQNLAESLDFQYQELQKLGELTNQITGGLLLDDILESVFEAFRQIIPYNRIGLSLIDEDGKTVRARWAKTDQVMVNIKKGYSAPLQGSSLQTILDTGQPRILNNLVEYLEKKPSSISTNLILTEGIRSSLTCPLLADGKPVGFIFFSSLLPETYKSIHVDIFLKITAQLSMIVEKGRLVSNLNEQKHAVEQQHRELQQLYALQEEYIREVGRVTDAAAQVEAGQFTPESLNDVAGRGDALGQLARVFQHMAQEVYKREQSLKQQVEELRIVIDQVKRANQFKEITSTDYFQDLKQRAKQIRAERDA